MPYDDVVRLAHEDYQRRLELISDLSGRTKAFQRWMYSSFDLYGWFYLSLEFAHEGFAVRKREALRHGLYMEDEYIDVLCESNDALRYGVEVPTFYGYIARTCVREAVSLFELFVFCLLEEAAGRRTEQGELRTPGWVHLVTRVRTGLGVDLDSDTELTALRGLRHTVSHRLFGPTENWQQPGLSPQEVLDALDLLEDRVHRLDELVSGLLGGRKPAAVRWPRPPRWLAAALPFRQRNVKRY